MLAEQLVEPTVIKDVEITEEEIKPEENDDEVLLSVTEEGELVDNADSNGNES